MGKAWHLRSWAPRALSKLLFEAYLLKRVYKTLSAVEAETAEGAVSCSGR